MEQITPEAPEKNGVAAEAPARQLSIDSYWPRYRRRALLITICMQVTITVVVGCALIFAGFDPRRLEFIATIVATLGACIGCNILLFNFLLQPLKDISAAITHVSGEPSSVIPPNPNARNYERAGFKPLLQFIYTLALDEQAASTRPTESDDKFARLSTALDQSSASMIILSGSGEVQYASRAAPVRTNKQEALELMLQFDDDLTFDAWLKNCRGHLVHAEHSWLRVPNAIAGTDDRRIYDITASYEKGSAAEVVLMLFDRTDYYQPEDEQLDFISFAAHELRGPITVIRGYLDVLQDELQSNMSIKEQTVLLSRLVVSANRLSSYISNILNASRYDQRHMRVNLTERSFASIYDQIRDDMQLRATTQNRALSVTIPDNLPKIAADASSLSEVFSNLIDNAIKYSNEGGVITVTARAVDDMVRVDVVDQGIGMPANVVSNLFHKFYRSHRSRETVSGTGIGLYISKAIVESHGGTIEVRSEVGKGSTFSVTLLPYDRVAEKLRSDGGSNEQFIRSNAGSWIKNHAKFRS